MTNRVRARPDVVRASNKLKAQWKAQGAPCVRCGREIDYGLKGTERWGPTLDHLDPLATGADPVPNELNSAPAHNHCNSKHGSQLARQIQLSKLIETSKPKQKSKMKLQSCNSETDSRFLLTDALPACPSSGNTPDQPEEQKKRGPDNVRSSDLSQSSNDSLEFAWRRVPWISSLLDQRPEGAAMPHYMTAPHPKAVDSLGPHFAKWADQFEGKPLRWWQELVATRMLEIDAKGELVWFQNIVSAPRQQGKSVLLRLMACYRLVFADEKFGETQTIMNVAPNLSQSKEIHRPARIRAKHEGKDSGWDAREGNGQEAVHYQDSRWLVRTPLGAVGYTCNAIFADEAWDLTSSVLDDSLEPTLVERRNPQLWLISTAHRFAKNLMMSRRAAAIAQIHNPIDSLILEWSPDPDAPIDSLETWQQASPHWSEQRQRMIARKYQEATAGDVDDDTDDDPVASFQSQWLNRWPDNESRRVDNLVDRLTWLGLRKVGLEIPPATDLTVAVEDSVGKATGVAIGWIQGERYYVIGREFPSTAAAFQFVQGLPPGTITYCGITLKRSYEASQLNAIGLGSQETRSALPLFAEIVRACHLTWDGDQLAGQIASIRVRFSRSTAGRDVIHGKGQTHIARAAAWVVQELHRSRGTTPEIW